MIKIKYLTLLTILALSVHASLAKTITKPGHNLRHHSAVCRKNNNYLIPPPPPYVPSLLSQNANSIRSGSSNSPSHVVQNNPYVWERGGQTYAVIDNGGSGAIRPNKYLTFFN